MITIAKQPREGMGTAVVDLNQSPIADGAGGSQHEDAHVTPGTRASPIDVEALDDEGTRNRMGTTRRRPVVVVDLEADTDQQDCADARTTVCRLNGSKRRKVPSVICLSPDREERSGNQQKSTVRVSGADAAPKEPTFTCPVCLNKMEQPSATSCGHIYCENCIKAAIKVQKKCPTCRKKLGPKGYRRVYLPTTADQGLA